MKYRSKKFIVSALILLLFTLAIPKPAFAQLATFEANPFLWIYNIFTSNNSNVTAGATVAQIGETLFEWGAKIATESLKRQLLNMIVDQIVNWIQGGGDPKFVTDWPGFLRDAVDQAGGKFLKKLGLSQLCSPFKEQLRLGFIPIPTFTERTSCTLSQVGVNLDAFLNDFKDGGWVAWNEMILKPQNNIYGAYVMAWDQYEIEKSAAEKAALAEAQAGKGFLSAKRCIASHEEMDDEGEWTTTCDKYEVVTPGAVVGDLAAKAVGSDIDWLVNADDLGAYVAAITNAILNRVFAEGVGLLHTAISSSAGGSGGGGSGASAQAQCAQLLGTSAYGDCVTAIQNGQDMREFQKNNLIATIDEDLKYRSQLLAAKQVTLNALNQSVDILKELYNCQGWVPSELATVQNTASTTAQQVSQIQSDIIFLQVKQQEVKAITNLTQVPTLFSQINAIVKPAEMYSLVTAAQDEANKTQRDLSSYQNRLDRCRNVGE